MAQQKHLLIIGAAGATGATGAIRSEVPFSFSGGFWLACRRISAAQPAEYRHAPAHRFGSLHDGGGQRPPDDLHVRGRNHGGAVLLRDALRPAAIRATRDNDRFVLSKGHAAPMLYAAWAEAGSFPREELLKLRQLASDLEGHPTPRLPFVDVATGSLGQGICAASASRSTRAASAPTTAPTCCSATVRSAEGSVWEAARVAAHYKLDIALRHHRRQRARPEPADAVRSTTWRRIAARWHAFGWHAIVVDGHDMHAILDAYDEARAPRAGRR